MQETLPSDITLEIISDSVSVTYEGSWGDTMEQMSLYLKIIAMAVILGMLPMCFASGGKSEMVQPIALAVVGGLISSTFITLLVIPVLYSLVMKSFSKSFKKSKRMIKIEELQT